MVREFYDSFPLGGIANHIKEVKIKVRGKRVTLNHELIESVLELPHMFDEDENNYFETIGVMPSTSSLHDTTYTNPRSLSAQSTSCIEGSHMKEEYRALWLFVRYNLVPTSMKAEVPM